MNSSPRSVASRLRAFLLAAILPCYRPRARGSIRLWSTKNVELTPTQSPGHPGPYDDQLTPHTWTIMEFPNDPRYDELIVKKSSQSGCTEACLNIIRNAVAERPTNVIYHIDTATEAKKICATRLVPTIRRFLPDGLIDEVEDDDLQAMILKMPHMLVHMAGGHASLTNKPAGLGICDELDEHPKPREGELESIDQLRERLKTVPGRKLIGLGRPKTERGLTQREYATGTCEKLYVPCPHCGHQQELVFFKEDGSTNGYMRFDHCKDMLGEWELQRALTETYFECGGCRQAIREEHKFSMVLAGAAGDDWRATNPKPTPRKRSIHISDLYSNFVTWGELAVEYLAAVQSGSITKLQAFYNSRLALEFRQSRTEVSEDDVLALRGAYKRGTCPFPLAETALLVHTTDKQGDVFKTIRAAVRKNGQVAVIDWWITLAEGELIERFDEPTFVFAGETTPGAYPKIGLIDEGFKTTEVRDFCLRSEGRYHPSKGRGGIQVKSVVAESKASHQGQEMIVYHYDDDDFKKQLYVARIARFSDKRAGVVKAPRLWLPADLEEDFVRELHGERLVEKKGKWGFASWIWEKTGDNDFGDALKMVLVIWQVVGSYFEEGKPSGVPAGESPLLSGAAVDSSA